MAYTTTTTAVTGGSLSAAQWNSGVRDNFTAVWVYTTVGDIAYATSSSTLARLAKGAAYKVLRMNSGATAPEWGQSPFVVATFYDATGHSYSSTTERNMPNSSSTITLLVTSTIVVWARVFAANGAGNCFFKYAPRIDGTTGNFVDLNYSGGIGITTPAMSVKTGVAAGSRTILLREKEGYGAAIAYNVYHLEWVAVAFPE